MFRYKKNIQENDLPRKRVRKASKIAGSGGQYLEIRYPERGRKYLAFFNCTVKSFHHLEIRYPERGRKYSLLNDINIKLVLFGNKIPREGTEIIVDIFQ